MNPFDYKRVSTPKEAVAEVIKGGNPTFLAGGTNLVDLMKCKVATPDKLVDINRLELVAIEATTNGVRIGALATNADVAANKMIREKFPLLSMALEAGASPQLRNMATVGGNMMQRTRCPYFYETDMPCNKREPGTGCGALHGYNRMHAIFGASEKCIAVYPSDMSIALAALDATVTLYSNKGERTIPFVEFHRLPGDDPSKDNVLQKGEMITAVDIPANNLASHTYYLKVRDRASYAFALVSVAAALEMEGNTIRNARLAMGGVAHKPWRLQEQEAMLAGKPANEDTFNKVAAAAMKGAKGYGDNNFKLKMAPAAIVDALKHAASLA